MWVIKGKEREEDDMLIAWVAEQAARLLAPLGKRWRPVQGVVQRASACGGIFGDNDLTSLITAPVHDIGYAPLR